MYHLTRSFFWNKASKEHPRKLQYVGIDSSDYSGYKYMDVIYKIESFWSYLELENASLRCSRFPQVKCTWLLSLSPPYLPWSFFTQLRRLSGLPWGHLSLHPPSCLCLRVLGVSPSLFTAIPTSSSAQNYLLNRTWSLPASVSLCLSCLPPHLSLRHFVSSEH